MTIHQQQGRGTPIVSTSSLDSTSIDNSVISNHFTADIHGANQATQMWLIIGIALEGTNVTTLWLLVLLE